MREIINLIRNENMKIYRRPGTFAMPALIIAGVTIAGAVDKLSPEKGKTVWEFINPTTAFVSLLSVIALIIGAGMVSGEYSSGTACLYLAQPIKRWRLLLSKYVSANLFALFELFTLFAASFIVGGLLFGFNGTDRTYLVYVGGSAQEFSVMQYVLMNYAYTFIGLVSMVSFSFMLSVLFRKTSSAVKAALVLFIAGLAAAMALGNSGILKYSLFTNIYFTQHTNGTSLQPGVTAGFSLVVLAAYFVIFNVISWSSFCKKDITA